MCLFSPFWCGRNLNRLLAAFVCSSTGEATALRCRVAAGPNCRRLQKKNESNNEVRTRAGKTKKPSGQLKSSWNTRKEDCRRAHTGACTGFTCQLTPGVSVLQAIQLVALVVPSSTPSGLLHVYPADSECCGLQFSIFIFLLYFIRRLCLLIATPVLTFIVRVTISKF